MSRLIIAVVVIAVVVTVYAVVDCAMSDGSKSRVFRKSTWLVVILLVPIVGPLLWILVGRGILLKPAPAAAAPAAPDDDETFLRSIGVEASHDDTIRRLEDELRALDDEGDGPVRPAEAAAPDATAADVDPAAEHDGSDDDGRHTPGRHRPDAGDETDGAGGTTRG